MTNPETLIRANVAFPKIDSPDAASGVRKHAPSTGTVSQLELKQQVFLNYLGSVYQGFVCF